MSLEEENKRLKIELQKANSEKNRYKKLFEASADALSIIDLKTGKFVECNQSAIEMHGVACESNFLNLTPADISPERQPCGKPSSELATTYIEKAINEGPQLFQWVHSKLDGTTFPCLVSLTAVAADDSMFILAIGRDISELINTQNKLEVALQEAKEFKEAYLYEKQKFEEFVNLAPVGIAINRFGDGSFEYVNEEFGRFTGYDVEELNQMDYWHLTPKKYQDDEQKQLQLMTETGRYGPYKKEYIHAKGHTYPVLLSGVKIKGNDGQEYIWSVVQDISEQQEFENVLKTAKEQAESASKAKSAFLSNMSHEIRTPMNGVLGTLQLLQRGSLDANSAKLISNAIYSANALLRIINDILDYSKIESNELEIEQVTFSLKEVADSVLSDMSPVASEKQVQLDVNFDKSLQSEWIGDPVRIRQIIMNLVSNAVKFTPEGAVSLEFREAKRGNIQGFLIDVTDTGIGMSKEAVGSLFERFKQADASITRKFGGTGLGMSITNNLVSLMNGDIRVVSKEGKGTKFVVFLPLKQSTEAVTTSHNNKIAEPPELKGFTILIAEDNFVNQEIIRSMLEPTNANICFAENGKAAVEKSSEINPDLILMDIQMPIMDGKEAYLHIRKINQTVPIVALTANVMSENIKEYKSIGFTGHLGKPFDIQDLYHSLAVYLL